MEVNVLVRPFLQIQSHNINLTWYWYIDTIHNNYKYFCISTVGIQKAPEMMSYTELKPVYHCWPGLPGNLDSNPGQTRL